MDDFQKMLQKQAWDYFEIVAAQRLTVLNFYIAISSILASVQFALLRGIQLPRVGAYLGILLVFLSFVFWKWDKRSSDMVKIAEEALKYFEDLIELENDKNEPHVAKIFGREAFFTNQRRGKKSVLFWRNYFTYRTCLNLIFLSFAFAGIAGIITNVVWG